MSDLGDMAPARRGGPTSLRVLAAYAVAPLPATLIVAVAVASTGVTFLRPLDWAVLAMFHGLMGGFFAVFVGASWLLARSRQNAWTARWAVGAAVVGYVAAAVALVMFGSMPGGLADVLIMVILGMVFAAATALFIWVARLPWTERLPEGIETVF